MKKLFEKIRWALKSKRQKELLRQTAQEIITKSLSKNSSDIVNCVKSTNSFLKGGG